jgi:hypothetical protein
LGLVDYKAWATRPLPPSVKNNYMKRRYGFFLKERVWLEKYHRFDWIKRHWDLTLFISFGLLLLTGFIWNEGRLAVGRNALYGEVKSAQMLCDFINR